MKFFCNKEYSFNIQFPLFDTNFKNLSSLETYIKLQVSN